MTAFTTLSTSPLPPTDRGHRDRHHDDSETALSLPTPLVRNRFAETAPANTAPSDAACLEGYFIDKRGNLSRLVLEEFGADRFKVQAHLWLTRARAETGQLMVNPADRRSQIVFSGIGDEDQILVEVIRQSKYDMSEDSLFEATAACSTHTAEVVLESVYKGATTDRLMEMVITLGSRGVLMQDAVADEEIRA